MAECPFQRQMGLAIKDLDDNTPLLLSAAARWYLDVRNITLNDKLTGLAPQFLGPISEDAYAAAVRVFIARIGAAAVRDDLILGRIYAAVQEELRLSESLGIYYSPIEVVDVILNQTLAPCMEKPAGDAAKRRPGRPAGGATIIDPSCGGGAFLLGAFDRLFQYHADRRAMPAFKIAAHILENQVFGMDIDPGGAAVTRLTLAARALERGAPEVPEIRVACVDALSDPHPAGWPAAYDAVVGNPPYIEGRNLTAAAMAEFKDRFQTARGKCNTFSMFVERGVQLLRRGGKLGFILPAPFLRNERYWALREMIFQNKVDRLVGVERTPFAGPVVESAMLFLTRWDGAPENHQTHYGVVATCAQMNTAVLHKVHQTVLSARPGSRINLAADPLELRLASRIHERGGPLECIAEVRDGISTGFAPFPKILLGWREGHEFVDGRGMRFPFSPVVHRPVIDGGEFTELGPVRWEGRYVRYEKDLEHTPPPPAPRPFNCQLREFAVFDRAEKIISRQTADRIICTVDRQRFFTRNSAHNTAFKPECEHEYSLSALALLLSSDLVNFVYAMDSQEVGRVFPQVHIADLRRLPIVGGLLVREGALDTFARKIIGLRADSKASQREEALLWRTADEIIRMAYGLGKEDYAPVRLFGEKMRTAAPQKKAA
jgi:adenine-specific DNA-methyltransferase